MRHKTISSTIRIYKLKHRAMWLHGNNCLCCGSEENLELDHIKPVSLYPELQHKFYNVQILCRKCNREKHNRDLSDYRLDINKIENMNKEQLDKLNNLYGIHLSKYPIKELKYLRKKL